MHAVTPLQRVAMAIIIKPTRADALSIIGKALHAEKLKEAIPLREQEKKIKDKIGELRDARFKVLEDAMAVEFQSDLALIESFATEIRKRGYTFSFDLVNRQNQKTDFLDQATSELEVRVAIHGGTTKNYQPNVKTRKALMKANEELKPLCAEADRLHREIYTITNSPVPTAAFMAKLLPEEALVHIDAIRDMIKAQAVAVQNPT